MDDKKFGRIGSWGQFHQHVYTQILHAQIPRAENDWWRFYLAGNTEQGKCRLTNEYPFFLFLIGRCYYVKNILYL